MRDIRRIPDAAGFSRSFFSRDPAFCVVFEEEAVEDLDHDVFLIGRETRDGFELKAKFIVGAALILVE